MLAYHFGWPYEQLMWLDHAERGRWVSELTRLLGEPQPGRAGRT
jgi:hypothetical protein